MKVSICIAKAEAQSPSDSSPKWPFLHILHIECKLFGTLQSLLISQWFSMKSYILLCFFFRAGSISSWCSRHMYLYCSVIMIFIGNLRYWCWEAYFFLSIVLKWTKFPSPVGMSAHYVSFAPITKMSYLQEKVVIMLPCDFANWPGNGEPRLKLVEINGPP